MSKESNRALEALRAKFLASAEEDVKERFRGNVPEHATKKLAEDRATIEAGFALAKIGFEVLEGIRDALQTIALRLPGADEDAGDAKR